MKTDYLLPRRFKTVGLILAISFGILCLWVFSLRAPEPEFLNIEMPAIANQHIDGFAWFKMVETKLLDEIAMLGLLVSLCFISLSKGKDEDEMTEHLRSQAFAWAFWEAFGLTAIGILFAYSFSFLSFLLFAIYFAFITYILKCNWMMHKIRRMNR